MKFENLLFELENGVATVTVNRPKALNALNADTIRELGECFYDLKRRRDEVRAVILTGAGDKSFVAGADIKELADADMDGGKRISARGNAVFSRIEKLPIPVIAAVNGFALGGGCELAMACHVRVASEKARFGQPEINLALIPGYGGTQRLTRLIGRGRALDLLLTGRMIAATEALEWGLVTKVCAPDELLKTATAMAAEIATRPVHATRAILEAVEVGLQLGLDSALKVEENLFAYCCGTEDKNEGTSAFLEKRKAEFKGS